MCCDRGDILRNKLKVGMIVQVKGKYDRHPFLVEILELGEGCNFTHRAVGTPWIISCHKYDNIIRIVEESVRRAYE